MNNIQVYPKQQFSQKRVLWGNPIDDTTVQMWVSDNGVLKKIVGGGVDLRPYLTKNEAAETYATQNALNSNISNINSSLEELASWKESLDFSGVLDEAGKVVSNVTQAAGKISVFQKTLEQNDIPSLNISKIIDLQNTLDNLQNNITQAISSLTTAINNAIASLDAATVSVNTGEIIESITETDGVISVTKRALVAQDIPDIINLSGTGLSIQKNDSGIYQFNVTLDPTIFYVVDSLPGIPAAGNENKICLVPNSSSGDNIYNEYIWVNNSWELLGEYRATIDLTPYLTISDAASTYLPISTANSQYLKITDASSTYLTKTDASNTYLSKTSAADTYQPKGNYLTSVSWEQINNKPGTYTPSAHTHNISDITSLQNALNSKADTNHTHSISSINGLQTILDSLQDQIDELSEEPVVIEYDDHNIVIRMPSSFMDVLNVTVTGGTVPVDMLIDAIHIQTVSGLESYDAQITIPANQTTGNIDMPPNMQLQQCLINNDTAITVKAPPTAVTLGYYEYSTGTNPKTIHRYFISVTLTY